MFVNDHGIRGGQHNIYSFIFLGFCHLSYFSVEYRLVFIHTLNSSCCIGTLYVGSQTKVAKILMLWTKILATRRWNN